jgi:hypothetical protein
MMTAEGVLAGFSGTLIALGAIWLGTEGLSRLQDRFLPGPPMSTAFTGWLARYRRYPLAMLAGGVILFAAAAIVTPGGS